MTMAIRLGDGQHPQGDVLKSPYQVDGENCPNHAEAGEHILEFLRHRGVKDVVEPHKAEVPLAHQGGGAEEDKAEHHNVPQRRPNAGKGVDDQGAADRIRAKDTGDADDQAADGAENEGVQKDLGDAGKALLHRVVHRCGGVDDRGGALSGFVGVKSPGDALLHGDNHTAHSAACHRPQAEGAGENIPKDLGNLINIKEDDDQAPQDIARGHQRHQPLGHMGQAFEAAQGDNEDQHHQRQTGGGMGDTKVFHHNAANGVGLDEVAADNLEHHKAGAEHRHPFGVEAVLDVVHRAAYILALFVLLAVEHTQNDLAVLGGHPQQGHHPHPEDGPHSPGDDRRGDPDDVAAAHAGGHRRAEGLEGGDGPRLLGILLLAEHRFQQCRLDDVREFADLDCAGEGGV